MKETDSVSINQWRCPMPKFDFDIITLGHGSGGLLTNRLLDSGIFNLFKNPLLDKKHDGAIFSMEGRIAISTDSFVVSPIFFSGGNIGDLAVHGTINDIAMCGAFPKYLTLSFILEEGLTMSEFWEILVSIKKASENAGICIITGDTKVVERGKGDKIFINTTGIGAVHEKANIDIARVTLTDKIIISGPLARHGISIMSQRQGLGFETSICSDTRPLHHIIQILIGQFGQDIHLLKDPTRGGVASVLNEVAVDSKLGIVLDQKSMPIEEEVDAACEILGLDPLYIANEGLFIAIVKDTIAKEVVDVLHQWQYGSMASVIGKMVTEHPQKVLIQSHIGGNRVLNMLAGEQLPRIC
ncbi:MAG: hydrogenase expression/formation protein HypE [Chitinophagaceae bacterium]